MNTAQTNRKNSNMQIHTGFSNALKCSKGPAESAAHREMKFLICNFLWEKGIDFATEVVFMDNQRADIVVKDWNLAIEVLYTEHRKDFLKKNYPMPTIAITADTKKFEVCKMLLDLETTQGSGWEYYAREK